MDGKKQVEYGLKIFQGTPVLDIVNKFKEQAKSINNKKRHSIRQQVLTSNFMYNINSITGSLHEKHGHIEYHFEDQYSAVFFHTCRNYHRHHLKFVAQRLSLEGQLSCNLCNIPCYNQGDIIFDAFTASYYHKIKSYEGATLIMNKSQIGSMKKHEIQQECQNLQEKTIISHRDEAGTSILIELKVLQIDIKDDKIQLFKIQDLAKFIEIATNNQSLSFEMLELSGLSSPMLINLLCFKSHIRIRNPLVHKDCKPAWHKNRLIVYSYEHIYCQLFGSKNGPKVKAKKIKCSYEYCSNYFDATNFLEKGIIINSLHKEIYEQFNYSIYGLYFGNVYQKNWHANLSNDMLLKNQKDRTILTRYQEQIHKNIQNLITKTNLKFAAKRKKKLLLEISSQQKQSLVTINLSDFNLLPARCIHCKSLNSIDAYNLAFRYHSSAQKYCPICKADIQTNGTSFTDNFYVDLPLTQFIYFEGHNKEIYYDIKKNSYFHKLEFYTGKSLKDKLIQQKKVGNANFYKYPMNIILQKGKRYVPFMDLRCKIQQYLDKELNRHFIYISENQKILNSTKCLVCNRQTRVDELQYNQQLQYALKNRNNQLRWNGGKDYQYNNITSIVSLRYYNDIRSKYFPKGLQQNLVVYWKNYQGTLIQYPFKFKGCNHSLETSICDFSDLIYQAKYEGLTKFRCRYKQCILQYEDAEDLQRVQIEIYSQIISDPDLQCQILSKHKYWVTFNLETGSIIKVSSHKNSIQQGLAEIDNYRDKCQFMLGDKKFVKEQIKSKQIEIQDIKIKINEDQFEFNQSQAYKHSSSREDFNNLKYYLRQMESAKNKLQGIKEQLQRKQMNYNRQKKNKNFINFSRLRRQYPKQTLKLNQKIKKDQSKYDQDVNFNEFITSGNLFKFKYPVQKYNGQLSYINQESLLEIIKKQRIEDFTKQAENYKNV